MTQPPFVDRPGPADRLVATAGAVERLLRAAGRRLAAGRPPWTGEDLARLRPATVAAPPPAAARGRPLLWLPALPWAFRRQRPQRLALAAAAAGHPAIYVEAFSRQLLRPRLALAAPAPGVQVVRLRAPGRCDLYRRPLTAAEAEPLADRLVAGLAPGAAGRPLAVVAQLPGWAALGHALRARLGVPLVYDRIDLHTGFPGVPRQIGDAEEALIAAADLVTATSDDLAARCRPLGARVELLPNAVDAERFDRVERPKRVGGTVRAGFVGALDGRVDGAALAATAAALPGWSFHFAGRIEDRSLTELGRRANVTLAGEIPHHRVPALLAALDVGLVPYRDTPLARAVDPVKLYEMLAAGLPVVARRLPGTARWSEPLVYLYDDPGDLATTLERARAADTPDHRDLRRAAAGGESWHRRAVCLLDWIADLGDDFATVGTPPPGELR